MLVNSSRRRLFRNFGKLVATSPLYAACQSMDKLFLGEYKDDAERVTIIGAGLSGLTSAFYLKKRQIPYQIFEASSRVGGRIYSVPEFLSGQPVAELGAEWIRADHVHVFRLASELRLNVFESRDLAIRLRQGDKSRSLNDWPARVRANLSGASEVSSVQDLIRMSGRDKILEDLLTDWSWHRYGVSPEKIKPIEVLKNLSGIQPTNPWYESRFRIRGGASLLAEALFERLAGVQPERTFNFQHKLKAVGKTKRGFELVFETPRGETSISVRSVICCIPVSVLLEVDGIKELPGPWNHPEEFSVGTHAKVVFSYGSRFWANSMEQGLILKFLPDATLWESSFKQGPQYQFRQGVMTLQLKGEAAKKLSSPSVETLKLEIAQFFKAKSPQTPLNEAFINWHSHPLFKGTIPYPYPGRLQGLWKSADPQWQWAGDYASDEWRGSLQGAIATGIQAVESIANVRALR